jgi:uncharacterized protein YbjT (DUF2867 family)
MSPTPFITGATGNIGAQLTQLLTRQGIPFTAGTRCQTGNEPFPTVAIDYARPDGLEKAFAGHRVLYLLIPDDERAPDWAAHAIKAAGKAGISHLVRSSGIGAAAHSPYQVLRYLGEIEDMVRESGLDYTIVRPNSFFQNLSTYHAQAVRSGGLYLPQGEAKVSYVDVRDVAGAVAAILQHPHRHGNQTYTLTGERALSTGEMTDTLSRAIGKTIRYYTISDEAYLESMRQYGLPEWNAQNLLSLYQADRAGQTALVTPTVLQLTGQSPIAFAQFAEDYRQVWR